MREDDLPGRLGEMIRYGRVASVDLANARVVVDVGDMQTAPIRWVSAASGATRIWSPPSVGEQILLLAPEGDIAGAIALRGIWSDAFPPPAGDIAELIRFADGATLSYDPEGHALDVVLPAGATVSIVAPGGVTIDTDVRITGNLQVDGRVEATDDVIGGGKSLKDHRHIQVQAGTAVSGVPQ